VPLIAARLDDTPSTDWDAKARLPHWSAQRFASWDLCPSTFRDRYVDGLAVEVSEAMAFGSAVHKGLEAHYKGEDGDRSFRRAWATFADGSPNLTAVGLNLLDAVRELGLVGTPEWRFEFDTSLIWGLPVIGYVDLVGGGVVYDFKTSMADWGDARARRDIWQPALYSWAVAQVWGEWPRFEYVILNKQSGKVSTVDASVPEEKWNELDDRIRTIWAYTERGDFPCVGHGKCPECAATWDHGHVCDLTALPPRIGRRA